MRVAGGPVRWMAQTLGSVLGGAEAVATPDALGRAAAVTTLVATAIALDAALSSHGARLLVDAGAALVSFLASVASWQRARRSTWRSRFVVELVATLTIAVASVTAHAGDVVIARLAGLGVVAAVAFATTPAWATVCLGIFGVGSLTSVGALNATIRVTPLATIATVTTVVGLVAGWLARLAASGHLDALTGTLNRRGFAVRIDPLLAEADREGLVVGVLMLDLDSFKQTNDRLGPPAADQLLVELGRCLRQLLRPYDLVIRWGGDEFLLVVPLDSDDSLAIVAERLSTRCDAVASFSVGSSTRRPGEPIAAAIARADAALLEAKKRRPRRPAR